MRGSIPPFLQYFMAWCLVKHRDNFTFTITDGYSSLAVTLPVTLQFLKGAGTHFAVLR